ncbi:MAG TPA: hypothetical protein VKB50_29025 [Vicinamibacterales bacterium]|nr:hypothetical protein [Vicinamibacterales bacterium]
MDVTTEVTRPAPPVNRGRALVMAFAAVLAVSIAYDMWRMPVQVSDSLQEILDAQASPSVTESFRHAMGSTAYLRPLRIAQIKAVFDLSQGHYTAAYRGVHVVLIVTLIMLFARALPVTSGSDAAAAVFALTVLTGLHTFLGFLREAFPINHFLEIAVFALVALNLSLSRGGWWADVLAAVTLVCASLTLESGILVWVVIVAAWLCGLRGVSTRGVVVVTFLLGGYFFLRFSYLHTGLPSLTERSAGFLFERLERNEVQERFGNTPMIFYAYNIVVSLLSVLLSEPRDGLFVATRAWSQSDVKPLAYLAVGSSLAMTLAIAGAMIWRWRRRAPLDRADRIAIVAGAVILANAVLSFSYAKDDIVALGGAFYAFAVYAAMRAIIEFARGGGPARAVLVSGAVFTLGTAWAVRSSGVHFIANEHAFRTRNDWAKLHLQWEREGRWPKDPKPLAVVEKLRRDALDRAIPNIQLAPEWKERWYGD